MALRPVARLQPALRRPAAFGGRLVASGQGRVEARWAASLPQSGPAATKQPGQAHMSTSAPAADDYLSKLKKIHQDAKDSCAAAKFASQSSDIVHFKKDVGMGNPVWSFLDLQAIQIEHTKPDGIVDHVAHKAVKLMRTSFDIASGYLIMKKLGKMCEQQWLTRVIFLETVAGIPGMVAGTMRHLNSLRLMKRDGGWIHTLLAEAENERMHLMIALSLRKPGPIFRTAVCLAQVLFYPAFSFAYIVSPKFCHRFVGYLEEEAVVTYSRLLEDIDDGKLPVFATTTAPNVAREYYQLDDEATIRDLFECIRADESEHRDVNHAFASTDKHGDAPAHRRG